MQLPNWWQACALYLAAARLRAVIAPVMTTIRRRELERLLSRVGASVFVTVDRWDGFDHADLARSVVPDLPGPCRLVVLGQVESDLEIDFGESFEATPWEQRHPVALDDAVEDPDAVFIVLFTSGTSGEPKGVLGTQNTWYAGCLGVIEAESINETDASFTPNSTMYSLGLGFSVCIPLITGARAILLDSWSGAAGLAVLEQARVAVMMAGARYYDELVAAAAERPTPLPSLRVIAATGTKIPGRLVKSVIAAFGIGLRAEWGMTECGCAAMTRADDPIDWALQSDGRPFPGYEFDIRSDTPVTPEQPGRLFVRGPAVCLATARGKDDQLTVISEDDDGWYDTGDLATRDGHGGIRLMGRVADRIGKGFMIPVADVEDQLMRHPAVADVAVVGYLDEHDFELACAVITVRGETTPTLDELRAYLAEQGMTEWYLPTRLERLDELPKTSTGKIRKEALRSWLNADLEHPS
ncbi:cyclohexanecarboxylate-CoA ligase [Actinopolymorpha pittospori]|uniref:Cyclohexanecarboxylate-CoA ligase n=2 Tax=Actinopolymorpha pittospori TaxID=648752 RepID=A0A927RQT8_9ACTN|nr:cyclohexanecarboxylate-CoA ligase [Actinopolymorpha pittospori]